MNTCPKTAICQINPVVGDLRANSQKIIRWIGEAYKHDVELIVFPELCLTGYPPRDLLLKTNFLEEQRRRLDEIAAVVGNSPVIVGCVDFAARTETQGYNLYDLSARASVKRQLWNSAAVLRNGKVERYIHKTYLPDYDVFDEKRYFDSASLGQDAIVKLENGTKLGISICEDIWVEHGPSENMKAKGANLILNISASPFYARKFKSRLDLLAQRAKEAALPLIYVNSAGAQDDLLFDGRSLVMAEDGKLLALAKGFEEDLFIYSTQNTGIKPETDETGEIWLALKMGIRDYIHKNGFKKVALGVSGGIDSALVAALAADALGAENVLGLVMPSQYSSRLALKDALLLTNNLRIKTEPIPIDDLFLAYLDTLSDYFAGTSHGIAEQNIQARIRGNLLMAFANKFGYITLATGNKSELAVGYATLYGDMAGGLAPIGDVPKTMVYELANWFNNREGTDQIPSGILERPPSAELAPNQRDRDDLPPYEVLDKILELYVEQDLSSAEIIAQGMDEEVVHDIINRIDRNEHKRRQAALILKITPRAFGIGRRMPITNHYKA